MIAGYKFLRVPLLVRTFLVRFGGIRVWSSPGLYLTRRSRDKMPMMRPNSPDMPLIRTKKVPLGISAK